MTADVTRIKEHIAALDSQLDQPSSPERRVDLINRLLSYRIFTDPEHARQLLKEQEDILNQYSLPEYELSFYQYLALLENQDYDFAAAEVAHRKALELIKGYGTIQQRIDTCVDYAGTLINLGRIDEALEYHLRADRLLTNYPNDELRARCDCRHGFIYLHTNRYTKAIKKFLQAFNYLGLNGRELSFKGHYFYTIVNTGLGNVYQRTGEFDKAIEAFQRTINRCEAYGIRGRIAWHHLNLGNAYLATAEFEPAAHYFALVLDNEADSSLPARAAAYANLGSCYIEQERYRAAEELLNRAEEFYRGLSKPDYANAATIAIWRARILEEENNLTGAVGQLEKALILAEDTSDPLLLADISRNLAHYYAEMEDYAAAYQAQLDYDRYQRRQQEQLNRQRQQELEAQYQTEAKEKEAERLKLKAGQLQLKELRAQMNPHFLYNCLNSIQSFISTNEAGTASKYLAKFAMLMRQSLEYTDLEYISLENEIAFLSDYLDISCHLRFEGRLMYNIQLDEEIEEDILGVPTMIIQPYVENAIEHGLRGRTGGKIDIRFDSIDEASIRATITDNGIGRKRIAEIQAGDATRVHHRSRGTEITLSRLNLLQPDLGKEDAVKIHDLYDTEGKATGTSVEVIIPVVDLQLI
ncbi:MAG: tetratricopeptide repeat protein [Bacteroidota bacterium]